VILHKDQSIRLAHKHKTRLKRLSRDEHSSLLRKFVNYVRKNFYNTGPWPSSLAFNAFGYWLHRVCDSVDVIG
jgi:hypothetical protein